MGETTGEKEENKNVGDHGQIRRRRPSAHSENKKWETTSTQTPIRYSTGQEKLKVEINKQRKNTTQTGAVQDTKIEHTSPQVGEAAGTR